MQEFTDIENHRENQRNQNNQRGQGNNYRKASRKTTKTTFGPMSTLGDVGPKIVLLLFVGFLDGFR